MSTIVQIGGSVEQSEASYPAAPYTPPVTQPVEPPGLIYQPDHAQQAQDLLISQFEHADKLHALVAALVGPFQELEQHAFTVQDSFDVYTATGRAQDYLGAIVGVRREGRSDVGYRAHILARILTNTSDCNAASIYGVARALIGDDTFSMKLTPGWPGHPAHYDFEVYSATLQYPWDETGIEPPDMVARTLADAIFLATSAGVSLTLFYQFADDAHSFTFSSLETAEEDSSTQGFTDTNDDAADGGRFIGAEERT